MSLIPRNIAAVLLAVILLTGGGLAARHILTKPRVNKNPPASQTAAPPPAPAVLQASYLISGDVFWGRGIDYFAQRSPLKYDWPFSRLNEFPSHDGWIADMECPVNDLTVPYQTQVDKLILQCPTAYLPSAAKWFTAMTLANNHTDNTGRQGFVETQQNLTNAGIQVFGDYDLSQIDNLCEVIALPATVSGQKISLPIAMCGYHWLAREPTDGEIAQITKFAKYFPVWVFAHGGTEYYTGYTSQQQALYRKFIDAGASMVIGDHPHVVEPTEAYKGKLIVYDLGNLIYDQWFDSEVTRAAVLDVKITATVNNEMQKFLDMGTKCAKFKDDCLQTAQTQNLPSYKMHYAYDVTAADSSNATLSDRLRHPSSPAVQSWLLNRLDWNQTLSGLTSQAY